MAIVSAEHLRDFNAALGNSLYFGSRRDSLLRSVQRWVGIAQGKVSSASDDTRPVFELAAKQLQHVESGVKIYRKWVQRNSNAVGTEDFFDSWNLHVTQAEAAPACPVECVFLWKVYYEINCGQSNNPNVNLVEELRLSVLQRRMPGFEGSIGDLQADLIKQALVNILNSGDCPQAAKKHMLRMLRPMSQDTTEFPGEVGAAVQGMLSFIEPPPLSFDRSAQKTFSIHVSHAKREDEVENPEGEQAKQPLCATTWLHLLVDFPVLGNGIYADTVQHVTTWEHWITWHAKVETIIKNMTEATELMGSNDGPWKSVIAQIVGSATALDIANEADCMAAWKGDCDECPLTVRAKAFASTTAELCTRDFLTSADSLPEIALMADPARQLLTFLELPLQFTSLAVHKASVTFVSQWCDLAAKMGDVIRSGNTENLSETDVKMIAKLSDMTCFEQMPNVAESGALQERAKTIKQFYTDSISHHVRATMGKAIEGEMGKLTAIYGIAEALIYKMEPLKGEDVIGFQSEEALRL